MSQHVYVTLLHESIKKHQNLPCLHIKRSGTYTSWTYQDFGRDCNLLAASLVHLGLRKGKCAAVIGDNSPEWAIAFHAIILSGACVVPIDPNIPADEIETILAATRSSVIFCSPHFRDPLEVIQKKHPFLQHIVQLEPTPETTALSFGALLKKNSDSSDYFSGNFAPDDPMVIIFTSGTTGKAKGVVLSQKNLCGVGLYGVPRMKVDKNDTVCAVLPLHHVFGCAASIVAPLVAGMDIVFVPSVKGPLILEALTDKQVTFLPAVPKMLQLFYDTIIHNVKKSGLVVRLLFSILSGTSDLCGNLFGTGFKRVLFTSVHKKFGGKLRLIISGGASLSATYWKGFRRFGFTIVEGYGLTETFGPITVCPGNKPKLGSVGPILPENEIKIVNPDVTGLGEVHLRGMCVFAGYFEDAERTSEVIDSDLWFNSGDLGRLDSEGFLFLSGRKKDVIVLDSGKNVYPDELEELYGKSPLIEELGIFGCKRNEKEIVAAVIVPKREKSEGKSISELSAAISTELHRIGKKQPSYRHISDFIISHHELPRTTTKKIKKSAILKLYQKERNLTPAPHPSTSSTFTGDEAALMQTDDFTRILDDICSISNKIDRSKVFPHSRLVAELGLDSLDQAELAAIIEKRLGTGISDEAFEKLETVGDLIKLEQASRKRSDLE